MADHPGGPPPGPGRGVPEAEILAVLETMLHRVETTVQRLHVDRRGVEGGLPPTGPERRTAHRDRRLDAGLSQVRSASAEMPALLHPLRRRVVWARQTAGNRVGGLLTRIRAKNRSTPAAAPWYVRCDAVHWEERPVALERGERRTGGQEGSAGPALQGSRRRSSGACRDTRGWGRPGLSLACRAVR